MAGTPLRQLGFFFKPGSPIPTNRRRNDLKDVILKVNPNLTDLDLNREVVEINLIVGQNFLKHENGTISATERVAHLEIRPGFDIGNYPGFVFPDSIYLFDDLLSSKPQNRKLFLFDDLQNITIKKSDNSTVKIKPSQIASNYASKEMITYTYRHP